MWKRSSKYGDKRCKVRCIDLPQAKTNRDLLTSPFVDVETTRFLTRSYSDLRSEECSSIYHRSISSKICSSFLSIKYADPKIGLFNFRSIGEYKADETLPLTTRNDIVFRCANPGRGTPKGKQRFRGLGITTVFDLRSDTEIELTVNFAPIVQIIGLSRLRAPIFGDVQYPSH